MPKKIQGDVPLENLKWIRGKVFPFIDNYLLVFTIQFSFESSHYYTHPMLSIGIDLPSSDVNVVAIQLK